MSGSSGEVKGWCPGALRPMRSGDGLIVRVRLTGGDLTPERAAALAEAARRFGNGLVDLTSRANLQMRGVSDDTLQPLLDRLAELGLLDASAAAEQVRNVIANPLAGLDPSAPIDIQPLIRALELRLIGNERFHILPAKFGFLLDGGGVLSLDGIEADIALRAEDDGHFRLEAGGETLGWVRVEEALEAALGVAERFLALRQPDERRMRDVVRRLLNDAQQPSPRSGLCISEGNAWGGPTKSGRMGCGPLATPFPVGVLLADHTPSAVASQRHLPHFVEKAAAPSRLAGPHPAGFFTAAAPFGRLDAGQLEGLAAIAARHGATLRLTPWRSILLAPLAVDVTAEVSSLGLVVDPGDPRLAIAACPGSPSCLSGEAPAQADAARLAPVLAGFVKKGASVHVSGCAKGCARRAPASITLVGQAGRYGIAFDADSKAPSEAEPMSLGELTAFLAKRLQHFPEKLSDFSIEKMR
ncbi:precorrin-3B synthase [Labrys sp. ZIDIC5]|uniref:precorrin-3B synthase n=1 Tax=Labrys sedimenti TaxID=3106036 RepID=UPI002ACAFB77|nr:precorrin-3B synthase [Labrys sp. ZIDIC5]MDZ5449350.1 precorrin-3B synthase [Labrys sp. ZIDIC5]